MYCPQCGQQQASEEMRFCSRCGFPLAIVAELLAGGGLLPSTNSIAQLNDKLSPRRQGVRRGTLLIIIGALLTPILGTIQGHTHDHLTDVLTSLSAIIFFLGGFLRILYAAIFESPTASVNHKTFSPSPGTPLNITGAHAPTYAALPSQRSTHIPARNLPIDTGRIVSPSSVTENTTRLLNDELDQPLR